MRKIKIKNFNLGEEVLITSYNPPVKAKIADMYELPDANMIKKYKGKNIPIVEVFINGRIRSFASDVVTKII